MYPSLTLYILSYNLSFLNMQELSFPGLICERFCFRNVENFETILVNLITSENFTDVSIMEDDLALVAMTVR